MVRELPRVASRANPQFKALRTLASSAAERRRQHRTLLDGAHLLTTYLRAATPLLIAVSDAALHDPEVQSLLERGSAAPQICLARGLFEQIAPVQSPTGIVALIDIPVPTGAPECGQFLVLLDGVQDPGNVGTIMRSAAGAGADCVLLSAQCADAWSPRTLRAGMGAQFALRVHTQCDLLRAASAFEGRVVAAAGRGGLPPDAVPLTGKIALVFGAEGAGLSQPLAQLADAVVSIPLANAMESLNVAAAAAVVLFERLRQQRTSTN
jgi:TrmH family RNA methyltransferase